MTDERADSKAPGVREMPNAARPAAMRGGVPPVPAGARQITGPDARKATLRRATIARRDAIDAPVRAEKSALICDALVRRLLGAGTAGGRYVVRGAGSDATVVLAGSDVPVALAGLDVPAAPAGPDAAASSNAPAIPAAPAGSIGSRTRERRSTHRPTVAVYAAFGSEADPSAFAQVAELAGWRIAYPCMLPREETEAGMPEGGVASNAAGCGQRMCMRAVCWRDRTAAPFLVHPTRAFAERDIDGARFPVVSARELDAIVVPLVAFDARGMRLGYGGGCYDRYLPTLSAACRILGIAFAEQQVEAVPVGEHDLPLPRIITA